MTPTERAALIAARDYVRVSQAQRPTPEWVDVWETLTGAVRGLDEEEAKGEVG